MEKQDRVAADTGGKPGNSSRRLSATRRVTSMRLLAVGAIGTLLYFAHAAFIPVALALLLALILSGPVEGLHKLRVPRAASAALLLIAVLGILAAIVNFLSVPAQQWFAAAPHTLRTIERRIRPIEQMVGRVDELRDSAGNIGNPSHGAGSQPAAPPEQLPSLLDVTRGVVLSSVTVVILTLFLLAGGPPMLARMTAAFASELEAAHVLGVIEKVRMEVGRFYVTMALINMGMGAATALAMMACGMPNPWLWGAMAAVFNFIPYVGATATLLVVTGVALVSFNSLGHVLAVAASYIALATIEGQFVQPLLVGRRLQLNPLLVFLALWFGGFIWGVAGVILATPALVALKVIAKSARDGQPLVTFLSPLPSETEPL